MYRYDGICIRFAALIRFGLAPHLSLAKISADPQNRISSLFTYTYYVLIIEDIVRRELQVTISLTAYLQKLFYFHTNSIISETDDELSKSILDELFAERYIADPFLSRIIEILKINAQYYKKISLAEYFVRDNRLYCCNRFYMLNHDPFRLRILELYYYPIIGYLDRSKILEILSRYYYWPKDYAVVHRYMRFCQICRHAKISKHASYGKLKFLSIFANRWKDILMNFVINFLISDGYDAILIIINYFTKIKYLIPYKIIVDTDNIAKMYVSKIWKYHDFSEIIILDRGTLFTSLFWKRLY
jgi:hypothetical protein